MLPLTNRPPALRYVHPKSGGRDDGDYDFALEAATASLPNYLKWIAGLCAPHLGPSLLDVGAGHGAVTQHFAEGRSVTAVDVSDDCVTALRRRFADTPAVRVVCADLRTWTTEERFDSVVLINVLEHILDDVGALESLQRFTLPGGTFVLYVPALNGLFGEWDRKVGHYRRYSKWRLRAVVEAAGLELIELRYANLLAIPAWLAFSVASGRVETTGDKSLPISDRAAVLWDRAAVPLIRAVEARVQPPLGLNLLCAARVL